MKIYKEYGLYNSKGVLFIIMKDSNNKLYKLVSVDETLQNGKWKPIKDIKGSYNMFEPTRSDYGLFIKAKNRGQA